MKPGLSAQGLLHRLAKGEAVSGEALAEQLGVTRAAIWKQIGRGYTFKPRSTRKIA